MKAFRTVEQFVNRHPALSAFPIVLAILLYLNLSRTDFTFYWDSLAYWQLKDAFVLNGAFSLLSYSNALRAYVLPLLLFALSRSAQLVGLPDKVGFEIGMSLMYAAFLAILVPALVQKLYDRRPGFWGILLFSLAALLFWQGLFFYPLSDLPSFILLVLGTFLVLTSPGRPVLGVLAGLSWGAAVLVRPNYLIALPFLLLWVVYYSLTRSETSRLRRMASTLLMLAGLVLVNVPQVVINSVHFKVFSPFVPTDRDYPDGLLAWQLGNGIIIQKYETNIGETFPNPSVAFLDPVGWRVLANTGYTDLVSYREHLPTLSAYLQLVWNYPIDFLAIYARHAFNGLDVVYNTVYVPDVYDTHILLRLLNYSLWFVVVVYVAHRLAGFRPGSLSVSQWLIPLAFALPALASIPTAMEVRFMLPIQLLAYALVAFWVLPDFAHKDRRSRRDIVLRHLAWYGLFLTLCLTLSAITFADISYGA